MSYHKDSSQRTNKKKEAFLINTKCQIDEKNYYGSGYISNSKDLKKEASDNTQAKEMCVIIPEKKEMCVIVPEEKVRCVKVEEPPIIQEEKVSSNDRLYENLSVKLQSIDGLMKILSKKEGELTEEKKDTTTYDLMRKFIEKNPVFTRKNKFYLFNGTYYELSSANKIKQKMLGGFRDLLRDKSISFIEGAVKFLQIEPQISIEDKDVRDDLIVFNNLVLDINTGSTYCHSHMFNVTYLVNASFMGLNSPNTPVFDNFLYQITGGDAVLITRIWMMIGYILTPDTKAKSIFLLQGVGNSGKSLLVKLLQRLLSEDAFFPFDVDMLSSTFGLGDLFGKVLCVCQDMPNRELNSKSVAVLKELSGDDTVSSAVKYEGPIVFDNKGNPIHGVKGIKLKDI